LHTFRVASKRAEEAERKTFQLDMVLDGVAEAVLVIDPDFKLINLSEQYARTLGVKKQEVLGRNLHEVTNSRLTYASPDGTPLTLQEIPIFRALQGEDVRNEPIRVGVDGAQYDMLISATPVRDHDGKVAMAIASVRDVSAMRRLDRLKDEFISTASHELRSPLTVIRALAQLSLLETRSESPGRSEFATYQKGIVAQTDVMVGLINQMLDTTRVDSDALKPRIQTILLPELLDETLEWLRTVYETHTLTLDYSSTHMPWRTCAVNPDMIRQVISNLVSNAVKYSPAGSTVSVEIRDLAEGVEVSVSDEGMGIRKEDRDLVFSKFYRGSNAVSGDKSGLGLGLYITRKLIELHGGRIWFDPERDGGSTVLFWLPWKGRTSDAPPIEATVGPVA
jgi:PAS domain S-box-containing protein